MTNIPVLFKDHSTRNRKRKHDSLLMMHGAESASPVSEQKCEDSSKGCYSQQKVNQDQAITGNNSAESICTNRPPRKRQRKRISLTTAAAAKTTPPVVAAADTTPSSCSSSSSKTTSPLNTITSQCTWHENLGQVKCSLHDSSPPVSSPSPPSYLKDMQESIMMDGLSPLPTFYPTFEQFKNFAAFVTHITPLMEPYGAAKIVPPKEFVSIQKLTGRIPTHANFEALFDFEKLTIDTPTYQHIVTSENSYEIAPHRGEPLTVEAFAKEAAKIDPQVPLDEIHQHFWDHANDLKPIYGTDVHNTLFDSNLETWNLNDLKQSLLKHLQMNIEGVTDSFLYFGMYGSSFAWHHEDMSLYSTSYLHYGEPKVWYVVPREHTQQLEDFCAEHLYPEEAQGCEGFLKHKRSLMDPRLLAQYGIPVHFAVHTPNTFMITSPGAYHGGMNCGLNCAEAVNFALPVWMDMQRSGLLKERKCLCEFYKGNAARWYIDIPLFEKVLKGECDEEEDSSGCVKFYIDDGGEGVSGSGSSGSGDN